MYDAVSAEPQPTPQEASRLPWTFSIVPSWGEGVSFYVLLSTSHWMRATLGRGHNLGWDDSLQLRQCQREPTAES